MAATVVMLFCMGGNFALFPAETFRKFGANGSMVYGFMFSAFGFAAVLGPVASKALLAMGGYGMVFRTYGLLALVATSITFMLPQAPVQAKTAANDLERHLLFDSEQ
eukprot:gnl/TRDRNA2_/TRDRNA2_176914_c2_seq6.p2 gnl/TRDRNA2_/TRDRNA2_176914_c2~~gnl/TRDRNA2_/TRDRNA2_176914_c2_seq6.p2  ORF type:complete len:122 (+),score=21.85 gnl/TRDRNA2_/TRDRNA2_176914_c2_seq6:48-368(+)